MLRQKDKQSDIVFQAEENLLNQGTGEIVLTKGAFRSIPVIPGERNFESYVQEFCGMTGLAAKTLRFLTEHRDINQNLVINSSCLVKVVHSKDFVKSDLSNSLNQMFTEQIGCDFKIKAGSKEIPCFSYMLSSRSQFLAKLLEEERKEPVMKIEGISENQEEAILQTIKWIHTGNIEFSENIFDVIEILEIARGWSIDELSEKCQENIKGKLTSENVLDLLVKYGGKENIQKLNEEIWSEAKSLFLREFAYIQQLNPDLEKRIASVPGLMSQLFSHAINAKNPKKNRHVRFSIE